MSCRRLAAWATVVLVVEVSGQPSPQVEAILDRLEARGQAIEDLEGQVVYTLDDRVTESTVIRKGRIAYKRHAPNPLFAVTFDTMIQDGVKSTGHLWYTFDGRWFLEGHEKTKSIIKRDIAPPGTEIDLFSIDKAPFPIPFGQKKSEILRHFEVTLSPPGGAEQAGLDHLVCVPKPDSPLAKDYSKLEFFVSQALNLPTKIVMTAEPPDKITSAEFPDLSGKSINTRLPDDRFRLPPQTNGFAVVEERMAPDAP